MERPHNMRLHASITRLVPALLTAAFGISSAFAMGTPTHREEPPPAFLEKIKCPPPEAALAIAPDSYVPGTDC
jgi:hypothetical protein